MLSKTVVILQFILSTFLVVSADWRVRTNFEFLSFALLLLTGTGIGVFAIITIGAANLRIAPEPSQHSVLITTGPYRYVRHPMYAGLLLAMAGMLLSHPSLGRLLCWVMLVTVLAIKVTIEEHLLRVKFSDYPAYAQTTWRILPYVW